MLASLLAVVTPVAAHASEGERAASAGAGVGTFVMPGEEEDETIAPTAGGVLTLSFERGFSEALSYRLELSGGAYGGGGLSWSALAAGGLVYRFDVLKYVPYGLIEVGGVAIGGGPVPEPVFDPALQVGGGVDVLQSRSRSWGIEGKVASFVSGTTTLSISVRLTRRWGYF